MSVSSVTLGTFFTASNGKTVLGGAGGSGLDTHSLVTELVKAKSVPIIQDQSLIKSNTDEITALNTFQTLLTNLQSTTDALRNPPGVGNAARNVFAFTTGNVGNGGSAYVSITPQAGAALQSYNISAVTSVATAASQVSDVFNVNSANDDATVGTVKFAPGTITFASGATVNVTAGDSLNTIAANFNAASATSGVRAAIIQIDATHFNLSFTATKTGINANFDLTDPAFVTSGSSVLAGLNLGNTLAGTQAVSGTNAIFKINGVQITRQSNAVNDVLSGVTFNVLQNTPNQTTNYTATISADTATVQNTIVRLTTAYNALKSFEAQQTKVNADGTFADTATLSKNQAFRQTMTSITSQIFAKASGLTGSVTSLSDLGVTLTNQAATDILPAVTDVLTIDDTKLTAMLTSNFQNVKNLFGFNLTSDNSNLAVFKASQTLAVNSFTVDVTGAPGSQVFTATYTQKGNPVTVPLTATSIGNALGFSLKGPTGSALEGLQLIYGSTNNASIHVNISQGVAAKLYNSSLAATTSKTGTLAVAISGIQDRNTTLNDDITRVTTQVNQYQTQLLAKFGALEAAISKINSLLQSLNANQNAALTSSGR